MPSLVCLTCGVSLDFQAGAGGWVCPKCDVWENCLDIDIVHDNLVGCHWHRRLVIWTIYWDYHLMDDRSLINTKVTSASAGDTSCM